jgi:hypothetical protein
VIDAILLVVGLGLIGYALWAVAGSVRRLSALVAQQALQIAQLERDVKDAKALARKRLVAGRSGR